MGFITAVNEWRTILGAENVRIDDSTIENYMRGSGGDNNPSLGVLLAQTADNVPQIIKVAANFKIPIFTISTGNNWGYGASNPASTGCVILDLSKLTKIKIVDIDLGLISVEPGVTQQILYDYLIEHSVDLMVPVHGGGPDCSLIGNALERGYGITPNTDHFASLRSLEVVLADGSVWKSPFNSNGAVKISGAHPWGVGPFIEGIFSQGNFGVVTNATLALVARPEHVEFFAIAINTSQDLMRFIPKLRELLSGLGSIVGAVNIMNDRRRLSMRCAYPRTELGDDNIMSEDICESLSKGLKISKWTAVGTIYCSKALKISIRKEISDKFSLVGLKTVFYDRKKIARHAMLAKFVLSKTSLISQRLESASEVLNVAHGSPTRMALRLAYWIYGKKADSNSQLNPAKDKCGIIWFSPLVPMCVAEVTSYLEMAYSTCIEHNIEPLITFTSLSNRLFDSTMPILYDYDSVEGKENAWKCYDALFKKAVEMDCIPYRISSRKMSSLFKIGDGIHWEVIKKIKTALDPNNILSPGRYCKSE